ncbi:SPASM domain-containing protein [Sulfurimonas sp.]|uniref:SPASM domain-containing protein n=1 Tax=Sulfurimonas sp. TaxID=2022749 RepID=UPI003440EA22
MTTSCRCYRCLHQKRAGFYVRKLSILNSKIFKEVSSFSSLTNEECSVCPIKLLCGGACRARSYLETGSLFKNSEFCSYEKLAYINGIFENSEF